MRPAACLTSALFVSIGILLLPGCGPELSPNDLGKVVFEVPQVPESEGRYALPNPAPVTESRTTSATERDHGHSPSAVKPETPATSDLDHAKRAVEGQDPPKRRPALSAPTER